MRHKLILSATIAVAALFVLPSQNIRFIAVAQAACDPGTRLDKTTIDEIRAKVIKAGYKKPAQLRKGCDNSWHGTALKAGQQINIAVTPDGHVVEEGD